MFKVSFFRIRRSAWSTMKGRFGIGFYRFGTCDCRPGCTPNGPGWGLSLGILGFSVT